MHYTTKINIVPYTFKLLLDCRLNLGGAYTKFSKGVSGTRAPYNLVSIASLKGETMNATIETSEIERLKTDYLDRVFRVHSTKPITISNHDELFDPHSGYFVVTLQGTFGIATVPQAFDQIVCEVAERLVTDTDYLVQAMPTEIIDVKFPEVMILGFFNYNVSPERQAEIKREIEAIHGPQED